MGRFKSAESVPMHGLATIDTQTFTYIFYDNIHIDIIDLLKLLYMHMNAQNGLPERKLLQGSWWIH